VAVAHRLDIDLTAPTASAPIPPIASSSVLFVGTFTLQAGLHETPEESGLTFVGLEAAFAVASLLGARLATALGARL
jgi:hypothetical protein